MIEMDRFKITRLVVILLVYNNSLYNKLLAVF